MTMYKALPPSRAPSLRWLVDENLSAGVVAWLRARRQQVVYQTLIQPSQEDAGVLTRANMAGRVVLTGDTDFGELVYRDLLPCSGVVQLRLVPGDTAQVIGRLNEVWDELLDLLPDSFISVDEHRVRPRPLPIHR